MAGPAMTIDGDVVALHSFRTADRSRIVTEATVRTPDGDVVVRQPGGTVEDITMRMIPGPEPLALGMRVAIAAHRDVDLSRRVHVVVDSTKVLAYPPGYVRSTSPDGAVQVYWESGCVYLTVDSAGTTAIPGDAEFAAIDAAIATWNDAGASCAYMRIINEGRRSVEVGDDLVNVIKFRDTSWCRPAIKDDPAHCYANINAAALTTLSYITNVDRSDYGRIVDADIEINGVYVPIVIDGQPPRIGCTAELQNTMTHELGHVLGIAHPCVTDDDPARVDHEGNLAPSCTFVSQTSPMRESTMWFSQDCGETQKEDLAPDDILAVCELYAVSKDPGTCEAVDLGGGCCSTGGSDRPEVAGLLAGITLLLAGARRRRG